MILRLAQAHRGPKWGSLHIPLSHPNSLFIGHRIAMRVCLFLGVQPPTWCHVLGGSLQNQLLNGKLPTQKRRARHHKGCRKPCETKAPPHNTALPPVARSLAASACCVRDRMRPGLGRRGGSLEASPKDPRPGNRGAPRGAPNHPPILREKKKKTRPGFGCLPF